jgi:hypothetical protein
VWLAGNTWIITNHLNQPYALLAGPAFVGSILLGWVIVTFFKGIATWCRSAWQSFQTWRKDEGSTFWLVIAIFLVVSVLESGSYFNELLGAASLSGILGYAVALVIDLVAVECMRARLGAARMRDRVGQRLYLFGVIACAGLSAFANTYTSLKHYHAPTETLLPAWMMQVAPWSGMTFPLLIIFLSFASDYTADQTSTKLDPENYKKQEVTRVKMLEIQRDMLRERVHIERDIDQMNHALKEKTNSREFFLVRWIFPKNPLDGPQFEVLSKQQQVLQQQLATCLQSIDHMRQRHEQIILSLAQDREEDRSVFSGQIEQIQRHVSEQMTHLIHSRDAENNAALQPFDAPITDSSDHSIAQENGSEQQIFGKEKPSPKLSQQRENSLLDHPEVQEVLIQYPILQARLSRGAKSLTLEEIIETTGHSRKMVLNRIKDGTLTRTKNPQKFLIYSVLEWLKEAPFPKRIQEAKTEERETLNDLESSQDQQLMLPQQSPQNGRYHGNLDDASSLVDLTELAV